MRKFEINYFLIGIVFGLYFWNEVEGTCQNNNDCENEGVCSKGQCLCQKYTEGEDCSRIWTEEYTGFLPVYVFYSIYTALTQMIVFGICLFNIWKIHQKSDIHFFNLVTQSFLFLSIASLIRIGTYLTTVTNPLLIPLVIENTLFNISMAIWAGIYSAIALFWLEIIFKNSSPTFNTRRLKIIASVIIAIFILTCLVFLSISVAERWFGFVYLLFVGTGGTISTILIIIIGFKLKKIVKMLYRDPIRDEYLIHFVKKVSLFQLRLAITAVAISVVLVIWIIFNPDVWGYLAIQFTLRTLEFTLCLNFVTLLVKQKKKEREQINQISIPFSKLEESEAISEQPKETFSNETFSKETTFSSFFVN